ncbi:MAG: protein mraZ [Bacteroidales bacterium]|nr:MAG: protein mraZ [Bacteroidales bacterium]
MENFYIFLFTTYTTGMATFIGDYICKLDAKGRVLLPAALKRQMTEGMQDRFVIKKDIFENCLVLFPMDEWERQNNIIKERINVYDREHNKFVRGFFKDTFEVKLDGNNRLLLPKRLLNIIGADKELVLAGQSMKIEIWPVDAYNNILSGDSTFAALAEKIMGHGNNESNE